mmetsp:Transcript_40000/g.78733  ORF Transcript_40000/g.78733 Transcript_40000/m.78733 type:complete len:299 (-) Transcript_40000:1660-2556(-)
MCCRSARANRESVHLVKHIVVVSSNNAVCRSSSSPVAPVSPLVAVLVLGGELGRFLCRHVHNPVLARRDQGDRCAADHFPCFPVGWGVLEPLLELPQELVEPLRLPVLDACRSKRGHARKRFRIVRRGRALGDEFEAPLLQRMHGLAHQRGVLRHGQKVRHRVHRPNPSGQEFRSFRLCRCRSRRLGVSTAAAVSSHARAGAVAARGRPSNVGPEVLPLLARVNPILVHRRKLEGAGKRLNLRQRPCGAVRARIHVRAHAGVHFRELAGGVSHSFHGRPPKPLPQRVERALGEKRLGV